MRSKLVVDPLEGAAIWSGSVKTLTPSVLRSENSPHPRSFLALTLATTRSFLARLKMGPLSYVMGMSQYKLSMMLWDAALQLVRSSWKLEELSWTRTS